MGTEGRENGSRWEDRHRAHCGRGSISCPTYGDSRPPYCLDVLFIRNVTFMTADPKRLADFWADALRLPERRDEGKETIVADADWTYPRVTFQKVTESSAPAPPPPLHPNAHDRPLQGGRRR